MLSIAFTSHSIVSVVQHPKPITQRHTKHPHNPMPKQPHHRMRTSEIQMRTMRASAPHVSMQPCIKQAFLFFVLCIDARRSVRRRNLGGLRRILCQNRRNDNSCYQRTLLYLVHSACFHVWSGFQFMW